MTQSKKVPWFLKPEENKCEYHQRSTDFVFRCLQDVFTIVLCYTPKLFSEHLMFIAKY